MATKLALLTPTGTKCKCKAAVTYKQLAMDTSNWLMKADMRNKTDGLYARAAARAAACAAARVLPLIC